jgi:hypothetical protein
MYFYNDIADAAHAVTYSVVLGQKLTWYQIVDMENDMKIIHKHGC